MRIVKWRRGAKPLHAIVRATAQVVPEPAHNVELPHEMASSGRMSLIRDES